ncbi:MAG: hypothetical protein QW702_02020 [Candidatus Bathyarchaeia archaeon]
MLECKNVRSEKVAKYLAKLTDGFSLWMHDNSVYALFDVNSLIELKEIGKRLKRIRGVEFRFIKIRSLQNSEALGV